MRARVESCDETRTHTYTQLQHTHIRTHTITPHYSLVLFIIAGFSSINFFCLLHHCIPVTPLHLSFIPLFIHYFCNHILIRFYNIYLFIPIRKGNSKKSEVIASRSARVLARDRGLRRECRDGHGTRTPDSEIAAVMGDLGGLFFTPLIAQNIRMRLA